MSPALKSRLQRTAILCLIALVIGAAMGWHQAQKGSGKQEALMTVAGVQIGGPFVLTDQNDATVTEKNYEGQYKLMYFGFTSCPAICPTELQKITRVMDALGDGGKNIQPLFVTVDPERDTVDVMKSYLSQFHPRFVGLTGTPEQIAAMLKSYRIYANKVKTPEMSDYTMDHSSFVYLMGPADELLAIYRTADTAEMMTADIAEKVR